MIQSVLFWACLAPTLFPDCSYLLCDGDCQSFKAASSSLISGLSGCDSHTQAVGEWGGVGRGGAGRLSLGKGQHWSSAFSMVLNSSPKF
jgi:hypothetical protein